jgi:glycosyltransferase involved in cell wall biosynthesis
MPVPKISVIIPTYDRAHCIKDAIDSVLAQSFQDFELIVVDDGSTDNTAELLAGCKDCLRYIKQENGGAAHARNAGIKASRGEWIAFLDSDDTWEHEKLKIQIEDLRLHPDVVAHMVDAIVVDSPTQNKSFFDLRELHEEFKSHPFRERPLCDVLNTPFFTPCWMVKRKAIEAAGYFNGGFVIFEDFDLLTRVALEGPFYVNCYRGTNVRRKAGGASELSQFYQEHRIQSLENLVDTYTYLKKDSRLNKKEYREVCRRLGGVRCELFEQYDQQHLWKSAIESLFRSVIDEPGMRSIARAALYATCIDKIVERLKPRARRKASFRRSEMNRGSH